MDIRITGKYGVLEDIEWNDIPPFAVLTGRNGVGKSQLLSVIAHAHGAHESLTHLTPPTNLPPPHSRAGGTSLPNVSITNAPKLIPGETFHTSSNWPNLINVEATNQQIMQAIQVACGSTMRPPNDDWFTTKMAERMGISGEEYNKANPQEREKYLTPYLLYGRQTADALRQGLPFLFGAYRMLAHTHLLSGQTDEQIRSAFGEEPWQILNDILIAAELPYRVIAPAAVMRFSYVTSQNFKFELHDVTTGGDIVPIEQLSSGEKIIMSTALWQFNALAIGRHFKFLLLDEPDAHLHPSMVAKFLNVIQKVFVEARGVRVIMTTHSPSTVALTPPDSLFEMRRSGNPRIAAVDKASAIAGLTSGFVVVHEGMAIVLCEGINDPPFYEIVWKRLTTTGDDQKLKAIPPILFIYGKGKDTVEGIVPSMREFHLNHFHGLIDGDVNNKPSTGIHVLPRYAIENYLFDPILVWCYLHSKGQEVPVDRVKIELGQHYTISSLTNELLQRIADVILSQVYSQLKAAVDGETSKVSVEFTNGKTLQYPTWMLRRSKQHITEAFKQAFPKLHVNVMPELRMMFATINMIPKDLLALMKQIQTGSLP